MAIDIRPLTPAYAVSPQILPEDLEVVRTAGFTTVIDNRPEGEIPPELRAEVMSAAAQALGLAFVFNPITPGLVTEENLRIQKEAMAGSTGPVFAYCASGNRCSILWALCHKGEVPVDDLIATPARFGYDLGHLRARLSE